jgi:hypothetical protein
VRAEDTWVDWSMSGWSDNGPRKELLWGRFQIRAMPGAANSRIQETSKQSHLAKRSFDAIHADQNYQTNGHGAGTAPNPMRTEPACSRDSQQRPSFSGSQFALTHAHGMPLDSKSPITRTTVLRENEANLPSRTFTTCLSTRRDRPGKPFLRNKATGRRPFDASYS